MLKTAFDLLWRYLRFYSLSYFGTLHYNVILIWQSLLKFVKVCLNRRPGTSGLNWGHNSGFIQKVKLHFQASGFMPTHTDFERNSQTPSFPSKSNSHPLQRGRRSSIPRKLQRSINFCWMIFNHFWLLFILEVDVGSACRKGSKIQWLALL